MYRPFDHLFTCSAITTRLPFKHNTTQRGNVKYLFPT
uniref:Uncharacterized protein n=1 Tax=Arundo donax TaxID=35708 RepID=A0A0A8ZG01_ARUDO